MRMVFYGVPVKMAIPGFLPHALIPGNATCAQLDHSRAVTVISTTSPRVSISVREQVSTQGFEDESSRLGPLPPQHVTERGL